MKNRIVVLFLIFLIASLPLPAVVQSESVQTKLSPRLKMLAGGDPNLVEIAKQHGYLKAAPEHAEPMVDTLVLLQGSPKALEVYGARVRSTLGDVAAVDIPLDALETIANLSDVVRIEEARMLKPRLEVSVPETGANGVWGNSSRPLTPPWVGNTGRHVVVGVVDTGIDLSHLDFKDSFGKSRVLYVLDQNTGKECTKQQIDAGTCTQTDTEGHGTHVTGIAAGNGSATGNGKSAYRYIGMAPETNIIVVKTNFSTTGIIDGISYIQTKAASLGLPVVINLSLGGHFGPHDGSSVFEAAMDAASGAGKVIVAAAGNEAADQIHASGTVANGGTDTVSFSAPPGSTDVLLDLWYSGADQIGVKVTSPSGTCVTTGFRYPDDPDLSSNTSCGQITISTPGVNSANGDHEIIIELRNIGAPIQSGTWTITLTGSGCVSAPACIITGSFDVWIDDIASSAAFVDHIDPNKTVGMPATATKAIAAASYVTKTCWVAFSGPTYCYSSSPTPGNISTFSSLGPRRTCSNMANCAASKKPELAAPGQGIMSAKPSSSTDATINNSNLRDPDGVHVLIQGTSMAAPHVTGAVAMLLAQNAALTSDQVKTALTGSTKTDSSTETPNPTPNNTWGHGKLAVDLAIASVGVNLPPSPTPLPPAGVAAAAGPESATISWTGITNDIFLDGYNVYKSTTSSGPYTKANSSIVAASSFKVTGLTADTPYFFVVTSIDTPDIESADSTEVTATPTTAPGGGGGCGMIDLRRDGPSGPLEAVSYFLTMFLPLVLIRLLQGHRPWNRAGSARQTP